MRLTGIAEDGEISDDSLELARGHAHGAAVLGIGDAQVLGLDVHELELELGHAALGGRLEGHGESISTLDGLEGDDVLVAGALEDLGEVGGVEAERDGLVAAVLGEAVRAHHESAQGHVGGVHRLNIHIHKGIR